MTGLVAFPSTLIKPLTVTRSTDLKKNEQETIALCSLLLSCIPIVTIYLGWIFLFIFSYCFQAFFAYVFFVLVYTRKKMSNH